MEVFMPGIDITLAHNNISTEFLLFFEHKMEIGGDSGGFYLL
jgi:hypothetical protein